MHIKRTSSAKGRPPPFRPFSAVVAATPSSGVDTKTAPKPRVRACSASAVTFQMQLQFNLSRPVLSTHFQLKNDAAPNNGRQRGGRSSATSTQSSSAGSSRSPLGLPMAVSAGQTQRTMTVKRSARQRRQQAVGDVTRLSGTQCEQNRKRFETALDVADSVRGSGTTNSSLQYGSSSTPEPCSTPSYQSTSQQMSLLSAARSPNLNSTVFSFNTTKSSLPCITDTTSSPAPSPHTPAAATDRNLPEYFRAASCSIRSRTNGPTIVGSPLYNRQPTLLLQVNAAGHQAPTSGETSGGDGYNHERYKTRTAAVQQNMERVSSAYRVLTSPRLPQHPHTDHSVSPRYPGGLTSQPHPTDFSDVFLIPTADAEAEDFSAEAYFRDHPGLLSSTLIDEPEERKPPVIQLPVEPEITNDVVLGGEVEDVKKDKAMCDGPTEEPPLTLEDIQPQHVEAEVVPGPVPDHKDKEKPTSKPNDRSSPKPNPRHKKSSGNLKSASKTRFKDEKPDPTASKPTSANKERRGSAASGSDASSSLPSRPSSATYWRQKTWVDDVTVTSDKESDADVGADADPRTQSPDGKQTRPEVKSPEKSKPEVPLKSALKKSAETPKPLEEVKALPVEDGNEDKKGEPLNILNLNDLKRIRVKLPDFICPSSQDKSKESAVLDWLETTSNHWAMKTSPLL